VDLKDFFLIDLRLREWVKMQDSSFMTYSLVQRELCGMKIYFYKNILI